ncbi:MAG TPA: RdgB/HAM1 family non-canonical purine NTP pyrophosphatase [Gammaproteobacteria bacterium]|nr:RdgB/HAM1 family non-canonical purine NTP pyrophosphatase [Gammaproteobacteria bacterium]
MLATGNRGKVVELAALLGGSGLTVELIAQSDLNVPAAPEPAPTFVENALLKARHAARLTGLPAIADDSGLVVDALRGAPGVLSARFAGPDADDQANVNKLLAALAGTPASQRTARFHCVLVALRHPDDAAPEIATGEWSGEIALAPRGEHGFGYDPVFLDPVLGKTAAELAPTEKNRVSHRGAALRRLVDLFKKR